MTSKAGRPRKVLSDEEIVQVEALAAYLTTDQIADYFSIGRTTFYRIMDRQPEIAVRYKRGKAKAIGAIAQNLVTKARQGDNTCMFFYLKTQAKWVERSEHIVDVGELVELEWGDDGNGKNED